MLRFLRVKICNQEENRVARIIDRDIEDVKNLI